MKENHNIILSTNILFSKHQQVIAPRAANEWARDFDSWLSGAQQSATPMDTAWLDAQQNGYYLLYSFIDFLRPEFYIFSLI